MNREQYIDILELNIAELKVEKKELIKFLKDKIKEYQEYVDIYKKEKLSILLLYCKSRLKAYQEVLDFINKGGKDE